MSKFPDPLTRRLYNETPEDELGQSLDGSSWYGLYPRKGEGGHIVIEDTYGFVSRVSFATTAALRLAWSELETEQDLDHQTGEDLGEWRGFLADLPLGGFA